MYFAIMFIARRNLLNLCKVSGCLKRSLVGSVNHNTKKGKLISSSSVLFQDGISIMEMPFIIQVVNGNFSIHDNGVSNGGERSEGMRLDYEVKKPKFKTIDFEEESEMILGFMRCNSIQEVFNLLSTCPEREVTPPVALAILRKTFELEANVKFRNPNVNLYSEESNVTFTRTALLKQLIDTICSTSDPVVLINTLRTLSRESSNEEKLLYLEPIFTECVVQVTDGKFSINQVCEAIKSFHNLGSFGIPYSEKLWVGINDRKKEFTEDDICSIMNILPLVQSSRNYLHNIAERKAVLVWDKFKTEHVIKILHILVQLNFMNSRLLKLLSSWTSFNIHTVTEGNLRWIVYSFKALKYTDDTIQNTLVRYLKAKKNIHDPAVIAAILDYSKIMRFRNTEILDLASAYYVANENKFSPTHISSLMECLGHLCYVPDNSFKLFEALELHMNEKFAQYPPNAIIEIFLSCIYMQRFPLNFVKKIFNPYFLNRINYLEESLIEKTLANAKVLDAALTLEVDGYAGPLLPKFFFPKVYPDARRRKCLNTIRGYIVEFAGNSERLAESVFLPSLPHNELYLIDCILDMQGNLSFTESWKPLKFAICIHLPEHFDSTGTHLIGPQLMKKRHVQQAGYKFVSLSSLHIANLLNSPPKLRQYIEESIIKIEK